MSDIIDKLFPRTMSKFVPWCVVLASVLFLLAEFLDSVNWAMVFIWFFFLGLGIFSLLRVYNKL